ncbi:hypothetical protein BFP72_08075 [Reichenbachiella sp. 5M10]|uniref:phosphatase domain-containing protein n=1 Tax=Reichenbachiella sp. 5M10 TaxID=1889772 RepID=UPI000C15C863|nr:App1 family protein [Reichenbachiella sp. 5M10]PIB35354.1 hypothetical protein BFP72_08075 [Reichenbachiella sp. 5M10]
MPIVWQFSALHLVDNKTLYAGIVLSRSPYQFDREVGRWNNLLKIGRSYLTKVYANRELIVDAGKERMQVWTGSDGSFRFVAEGVPHDEPKVYLPDEPHPLEVAQSYPLIFENTTGYYDVISDIDDTIILSNTADLWKRVSTLVFRSPHRRKVIGYTQKMFAAIEARRARFCYVSKSEGNLFGMLAAFIAHNQLPNGVLFLTPYLRLGQLFNPKKGVDFKLDNIRYLLDNTGGKPYVLFGDDSQRDMEVYAKVVKSYPNRILKVYIRQTKDRVSSRQIEMMRVLTDTAVPVKYFTSDEELDIDEEMKQLIPENI